jgi:hypothetical protein
MDARHEANGVDVDDYETDAQLPFRAVLDEIKPQLELIDRKLRRVVRRNPLAALAVVTLAGFVLGRLFRR